MAFPEIYQRKFSCVNDVSIMIDVSIATVYSGGILTIFCLFPVFSSVFSPSFVRRRQSFTFFALVLIKYVSKNKFEYIFDVVIDICMTAGSGFKMVASIFKMADLWGLCDVLHVIIDTSLAQSVKLMTRYKRAKFHYNSVNTSRHLIGVGVRLRNSKKAGQNRVNG